jgi:hypothetical protein
MALTFTKAADGENVPGNLRTVRGDLAFDNSYPTGGEALTAAMFGLGKLVTVNIIGVKGTIANSGGLNFRWDPVNSKIMAFYPTGGAATPATLIAPKSATGASTASAVDATTPTIVAGLGLEVGNTTDLSTVTLTVEAVGY